MRKALGIAPIRPSLKQDEGIKVFDLVSEIGIKPARSGRSHNFFTTDQWTAGLPDLILFTPLSQQPGADILQQDDLVDVGVVPKTGNHPPRLRGVFDL
jgi:hypothetical protein